MLAERLTDAGLCLRVPLHIAPHGIDLTADFDLSGGDVLDISLALGDFGYGHMTRLRAQDAGRRDHVIHQSRKTAASLAKTGRRQH
ncbi:hypothetical protein [Selenomonas ruminantium]|uniref:hypothetical protein n=1 Tax=Selenomonas ruminantium TaxID=971 RepID=UPI0015A4C946|nr:hypothetical protein [Selenomonas ruminantium]